MGNLNFIGRSLGFVMEKLAGNIKNNKIESISSNDDIQHMNQHFESCSDTVYKLDFKNFKFKYLSPCIEKLIGYSAEELKKMDFFDLVQEVRIVSNNFQKLSNPEEIKKILKSYKKQKWQADYLVKTKNNSSIWISDTSCVWEENGVKRGAIGCFRDINERILAETNQQEKLVRLANTDPLTNLANRRHFFEQLELELKRAARTNRDLSVLLIDVDFFKKINDTYGHDVGDQMLIDISQIMQSCLRDTDLPARIGGEEFAIFLPDTPIKGAYFVAERICKAVAKNSFFIESTQQVIKCTVSIGVSCSSVAEQTKTHDLYKMADSRLYIAKNTGRNQVSIEDLFFMH